MKNGKSINEYDNIIEKEMTSCKLCPRKCGVNRKMGQRGFCNSDYQVILGRAALHMWEEPCISGENGSGTIFFTGCNMGCVFCQNHEISHQREMSVIAGTIVSIEQLSRIMLDLQGQGAHNINFVTPTHFIPQIAKAIVLAKGNGLGIPIVYNTGGYERKESLELLDGLVDIYLPDFKYMDDLRALHYSNAKDYAECAKAAIEEMFRQVGVLRFDEETGLLQKGIIVRHLVLPDTNKDTKQILRYLKEQYGDRIQISLMSQYTPILEQLTEYPQLQNKVSFEQYSKCVSFAGKLHMENVYIQEEGVASESFIPKFNGVNL